MVIKRCEICDREYETSGAAKVCSGACRKELYGTSRRAAAERAKQRKRAAQLGLNSPIEAGFDYGKRSAERDKAQVKVEFPDWVKKKKTYEIRKSQFDESVDQFLAMED